MDELEVMSKHILSTLGKGFSEAVYSNALAVLLRKHNIPYSQEVVITVTFENQTIGSVRADFVLHDAVVELKAVARDISYTDTTQLHMYMKLLGVTRGILICFDQRPDKDIACYVASTSTEAPSADSYT